MSQDFLSDSSPLTAGFVVGASIAFMIGCGTTAPKPKGLVDLYEAALRRLFEDDVVSAHPSDKRFFAITLEGRVDPPSSLLQRLDSLSTDVLPYSEAQTHPARNLTGEGFDRAGVYFDIERVEWVTSSHAVINAAVGSSGMQAIYRLELRLTSGAWICTELKQIAIS